MLKRSKLGGVLGTCVLLSLSTNLLAVDTQPKVEQVAEDFPLGQSAEGEVSLLPEDVGTIEDEDLFGMEGGYFHPYISVDFEYTDNLYNVDEGETENLLTRISPGVWFALPRKKIIPITINPNNSSPGGLQLQFEDYEGSDRFQAYALGGLDYNIYSEDSDLDTTTYLIEGMARWNMRGGLALQLVDRFTHGQDEFEIGAFERNFVYEFDSNFFMGTADWDITEKLRVQFDYVNFYLDYDDEINERLDRIDNGFNLYGYFNYSLQTSFFLEYRYVDVEYDVAEDLNNYSQFFYGGIKWDTTDKLAVLFKLGYQEKLFDSGDLGQEDFDGMAFDLQCIYRFSEKTTFELDVYRTNEETDYFLASDKTVLGATFKYVQKISDRWTLMLDAIYEGAEYSNYNTETLEERDDDDFLVRPSIQYLFRDWLMFELAYEYDERDSSDDYYDYQSNTILFSANLAL